VQADDGRAGGRHQVADQLRGTATTVSYDRKLVEGLDRDTRLGGVRGYGLRAARGRRGKHPRVRRETCEQAGQCGRVATAALVECAGQVIAPLRGGVRVPQQDQRHGLARHQRADHILVMRVAEPAERLTGRQPLHRVDLVVGLRGIRPCGPVVHPLGLPVDEIGHAAQVRAERGPDAGLLEDLAHRGDRDVLAGLLLSLGQRPVVIPGPVHEQDLRTGRRGAPQHRTRRTDLARRGVSHPVSPGAP
jgi:hypothetical protein